MWLMVLILDSPEQCLPVSRFWGISISYPEFKMTRSSQARLVDAAKISRHLDAGEIVLLSALAYSPAGETFNVRTEEIAARIISEK